MRILFSATLCSLFHLSAPVSAQVLTAEEIEQTATTMRQSGTPEETVQQFIEASRQANKIQQDLQSLQSGEPVSEDSVIPKENAGTLGNLFQNFAAISEANEARQLQVEVREFVAQHAEKPDFAVFVGDKVYAMKLMMCQRDGEAFQIHLEAMPDTVGKRGPALFASRSGPYAGGDNGEVYYLESLRFDSSDLKVNAGDMTGVFSGDTFSFDGMSAVTSSNTESMKMRVELTCS